MKLLAKKCIYCTKDKVDFCPKLSIKRSANTIFSLNGEARYTIPTSEYFCNEYNMTIYMPYERECKRYIYKEVNNDEIKNID